MDLLRRSPLVCRKRTLLFQGKTEMLLPLTFLSFGDEPIPSLKSFERETRLK